MLAVVLLGLAAGGTVAAPAFPARAARRFSVQGVSGTVVLTGTGTISGSVDSGEVWTGPSDAGVTLDNVDRCAPSGSGGLCHGTNLHFKLDTTGTFTLR